MLRGPPALSGSSFCERRMTRLCAALKSFLPESSLLHGRSLKLIPSLIYHRAPGPGPDISDPGGTVNSEFRASMHMGRIGLYLTSDHCPPAGGPPTGGKAYGASERIAGLAPAGAETSAVDINHPFIFVTGRGET